MELRELIPPLHEYHFRLTSHEPVLVFRAMVVDVMEHSLCAQTPQEEHIRKVLESGSDIEVQLSHGPDAVFLQGMVARQEERMGRPVFWVKLAERLPERIVHRRKHVRVPMAFPVQLTTAVGDDEQLVLDGQSQNLSGSGMGLLLPVALPKKSKVHLSFQPEPHGHHFSLEGRIAYCKPYEEGPQFLVAIEFFGLFHRDEDQLVGICFRREVQAYQHLK